MLEGKGKCSYCGGVISPHATICRHCGKYIQTVLPKKSAHLATHRKHRSFMSTFINIGIGTMTILFLSAVALMAMPASTSQASGAISPDTPALAAVSSAVSKASPVVFMMPAGSGGEGGVDVYEPPEVAQGGDCIDGSIIDIYHMPIDLGWTIDVAGPTNDTVQAGLGGVFHFPSQAWKDVNDPDDLGIGYPAGTYTLTLQAPSGWQQFTPSTFSITLNGSHDAGCALVRFKMETKAKLCVIKLDDGVNPPVGIPGFEITVTNTVTKEKLVKTTDGLGIACFPDLAPGDYVIEETPQVGWEAVPSSQPVGGWPIHLVSPTYYGSEVIFYLTNKQVHTSIICVEKKDTEGNTLNGWPITLTRPDGLYSPQLQYTGSDGPGITCFNNLALGDWDVGEIIPDLLPAPPLAITPWWKSVSGNPTTVTLDTPGVAKTVTLVNEQLGCVDGYKINDLDQGLPGWNITAQKDDEIYYDTTRSSPAGYLGYFQFYLPLGTWTISEEVKGGWTPVTPASFTVTVTKPGVCEHVRFKNATKYACVDVYKKDLNGLVGIPGWEINVSAAFGDGTILYNGLTNGTGHIRFNGLMPGNYTIWETAQEGWTACGVEPYSINPAETQVELTADGTCSVVVFYNCQGNWQPDGLLDP